MKKLPSHCDLCKNKQCYIGKDCFNIREDSLKGYEGSHLKLAQVSSAIEAQYYMQKTRLEELFLFVNRMGYKKLGIAFCIGLSDEAKILAEFLRKEFDVVSVCCKVCGIDKSSLELERMKPDVHEAMCNPIGQAMLLNKQQTELNIICGLCIGHDIQFTQHSDAPVTTFIVKDRVLAHNTAGSLYCQYLRKRI
ncbi:DUF1847 domain-containing protein [candidate division KSB1 bacterium]|nr:DUF1847 domain-containing protein [candidate division KSB1 bacterium]